MQLPRPLVENLNDCEVKEHSLPNTNLKLKTSTFGIWRKTEIWRRKTMKLCVNKIETNKNLILVEI